MINTARPFFGDALFWLAFFIGLFACMLGAWAYGAPFDVMRPLYGFHRFVVLVLVYPVLEELVFRGALQGWLLSFAWGGYRMAFISIANIITSLVFASLHGFYHPSMMAILVFVPSIVFGFFRDRTGFVTASIVLHISYNMVYFWLFGVP